jgi:hypothetical protein
VERYADEISLCLPQKGVTFLFVFLFYFAFFLFGFNGVNGYFFGFGDIIQLIPL